MSKKETPQETTERLLCHNIERSITDLFAMAHRKWGHHEFATWIGSLCGFIAKDLQKQGAITPEEVGEAYKAWADYDTIVDAAKVLDQKAKDKANRAAASILAPDPESKSRLILPPSMKSGVKTEGVRLLPDDDAKRND